jgi:hypothetical protein
LCSGLGTHLASSYLIDNIFNTPVAGLLALTTNRIGQKSDFTDLLCKCHKAFHKVKREEWVPIFAASLGKEKLAPNIQRTEQGKQIIKCPL